ncbi:MAG: hypothetical protein QM723_32355 [Myxococcaceae bacterium]
MIAVTPVVAVVRGASPRKFTVAAPSPRRAFVPRATHPLLVAGAEGASVFTGFGSEETVPTPRVVGPVIFGMNIPYHLF